MKKTWDIAVIGGGASGLAAAISAKQTARELSVLVLEKKERPGKKLSVTGNGKCNLSNTGCAQREPVMDFLRSAGIAVREEEGGRLYPYNEDAQETAAVLTEHAQRLGVRIITNCEVQNVEAIQTGGFHLFVAGKMQKKNGSGSAGMHITAKVVLVATGGKSYGIFGSTGDGYRFARALGHQVTVLVPALTAINTAEDLSKLKGIRAKAQVNLLYLGKVCMQESGEVQFRADGLSGICIMNLSGHLRIDRTDGRGMREQFGDYRLVLDLAPDFEREELLERFRRHFALYDCCAADLLRTLVKAPLAEEILRRAGIEPSISAARLSCAQLESIADGLRGFSLTVCGTKGWNEAQVTVGGVLESQVNGQTMESQITPGLYFAGEVLEYAGPCGGYNLHHAWLTGILAGTAMAEAARQNRMND